MKLLVLVVLSCLGVAQESARQLQYQPIAPMGNVSDREGRIVNGQPAAPGQFPYQVFLRGIVGASGSCGGSVISSTWILTASHCHDEVTVFEIRLGTNNINEGVVRTSIAIIAHPQYNPSTLHFDISVVQMNAPVEFNNLIQPVALPAQSVAEQHFNEIARVSGFGLTSSDAPDISTTLNYVDVRIISNAECLLSFPGSVIPSTICARSMADEYQGICQGDSGGPLVIHGWQIGIVSFVSSIACDVGAPMGYIRTAHFRHWISQVTGV